MWFASQRTLELFLMYTPVLYQDFKSELREKLIFEYIYRLKDMYSSALSNITVLLKVNASV